MTEVYAPARNVSPRPCLAVVVPCYNEEATVGELLKRVLASPWTAEVIVVDDASTDGTAAALDAVDEPRVRVLRHARNAGKGAALRTGFAAATADFVETRPASLHALRANVAALGVRASTRIFKRDALPFAAAFVPAFVIGLRRG